MINSQKKDQVMTSLLLKSLVAGPTLIGTLPEATRFDFNRLQIPDKFPSLNFRQKLGHIYEDALGILLTHSEHFDLVKQSLQIQKDKHTTVGELDYLIRDLSSGELIHLELATKFYLAVETPNELLLPGPDARDNYYRKLARLREHQLQLATRYRDHLPEEIREERISPQHLVYGCLFDHISSKSRAAPEFIDPKCRRGFWLHKGDLKKLRPTITRFERIPKALWPVPLPLCQDLEFEDWRPEDSLDHCVMIRIPGDESSYFVAPDGYPDHGGGVR